jgi:hypothetical protein
VEKRAISSISIENYSFKEGRKAWSLDKHRLGLRDKQTTF